MTASSNPDINTALLLASTIQCAIDDLLAGTGAEQRAAFRWLFLDDAVRPMTYLWCCAVLGRDPVRVRERLYRERPALIHALQFNQNSWNIQGLRYSRRTNATGVLAAAR